MKFLNYLGKQLLMVDILILYEGFSISATVSSLGSGFSFLCCGISLVSGSSSWSESILYKSLICIAFRSKFLISLCSPLNSCLLYEECFLASIAFTFHIPKELFSLSSFFMVIDHDTTLWKYSFFFCKGVLDITLSKCKELILLGTSAPSSRISCERFSSSILLGFILY
ncbi:unnamed protein product [Moneuplotes crassus]|uniref:Uncharacterized protein n=1 Tax=Euplotes crassus TaxID=5936 RepID=A0AAD1UK22_EUPCR|nr:unnamed protein product [Moneuplotes crassus]